MLSGFCFATPGSAIEVLEVIEDDFCLYLREHCYLTGAGVVAMDLDTKNKIPYGVRDLIRSGIKVVIVDPVYSPIHDKQVLPLDIHREMSTLGNHFPGAVCIGRLMVQQVLDNRQNHLQLLTACFNHGSDAQAFNTLPLTTLGWTYSSNSPDGVLLAQLQPQ